MMFDELVEGRPVSGKARALEVTTVAVLRRRAKLLDPRAFLAEPLEVVERALVRPLSIVAKEATRAFGEISAAEDDESELGGIAFAARLEARHHAQLLDGDLDRAGALIACDMVRQALLRSTRALLACARGTPDSHADDGRAAAYVRALYMRLQRTLEQETAPTPVTLARIDRALAETTGRPEFEHVRLTDRFVIESVHQRLVALARLGEPSAEQVAELLSDARATIGLLASINQRPELRAHDARLVDFALDRLDGAGLQRALLLQIRELLRGRDEVLDLAFDLAAPHLTPPLDVVADLRANLRRVKEELAPVGGGF